MHGILGFIVTIIAHQWAFDCKWVVWSGSGGAWAVSNWAGRSCSGRQMWWARSPVSGRCMFVMLPEDTHTVDGPALYHPDFEPCPSLSEWPLIAPSQWNIISRASKAPVGQVGPFPGYGGGPPCYTFGDDRDRVAENEHCYRDGQCVQRESAACECECTICEQGRAAP